MKNKKYDNIVSLGFFCSTALELERIGLRSNSNPFDWVLSFDMSKVIELINNDFEDFLNIKYLKQYKSNRSYYMNDKYDIHFYHDFDRYKTLEDQLDNISNKYKRRIRKFYQSIKSKTLFVRYISSQEECNYIEQNLSLINETLKKYNSQNSIIYIANKDINSNIIKIFYVEPDKDDTVSRRFIEKNSELESYMISDIYDYKKRKDNINIYRNKERRKKILSVPNKCINLIKRIILDEKIHFQTYEK